MPDGTCKGHHRTKDLEPFLLALTGRGLGRCTDEVARVVPEGVVHGHVMAGLRIEGRWVDVRDPEVLASLQHDAARSGARS